MTATGTPRDAARAPAFPMERGCPYRMPPGYAPLHRSGPLSRVTLYDGRQVWLIAGYDAGRALLLDPRLSSDTQHPGFPHLTRRVAAQQQAQQLELPLVGADNPEHARQRRKVTPAFGIRRIAALRPRIERIARELVDAMLSGGPTAELVDAYAKPLSFATTFAVLGVPHADLRYLEEQARCMLAVDGDDKGAAAERSFIEIRAYLNELVIRSEQAPGAGLIGELVAHRQAAGRIDGIDRDELAMTCVVLLGGSESTATTIASAVLALLEHPAQLSRLRAEPTLNADAVDELTRLVSAADELPRVALADIEIAGQTIRAGEGVIVSTMLMNRDPDVWTASDTLDIRRAAGRHAAFGHGIHQCLGQNLARAEMEIALSTLFHRVPTLRLAVPASEVLVHPACAQQSGVAELPVTW